MYYPKYRIKSQTDREYVHPYKPQVKYSFFGTWESIGHILGYSTLEETFNIIEQHKATIKQIQEINKEPI